MLGPEAVTDALQSVRVVERGEPVVQGREPDPGLGRLPFRPFMQTTRTGALEIGREAGNPAVDRLGARDARMVPRLPADGIGRLSEQHKWGKMPLLAVRYLCSVLPRRRKHGLGWATRGTLYAHLRRGRVLLDSLPYPDRVENRFVVDPDKFDYYAMDCYRLISDNDLAEMHAREIVGKSTVHDGTVVAPMRKAESEVTLGVVAARRGELDRALECGHFALAIPRRSQPSLLMVGSELDQALRQYFPQSSEARAFRNALTAATSKGG